MAKPGPQAGRGIAWPVLQTLTVNSSEKKWTQSLRNFLAARIDVGWPLQSIRHDDDDRGITKFLKHSVDVIYVESTLIE